MGVGQFQERADGLAPGFVRLSIFALPAAARAFALVVKVALAALCALVTLVLVGCGSDDAETEVDNETVADARGFSPASTHTHDANAYVADSLTALSDHDLDLATRGFIATRASDDPLIKNADGKVIWDLNAYRFIKGQAPDSVNPSLWRQAKLNNLHGLFKITERIYQVRGFDLSNMTIIQGDSGWIVVDPLTSEETAAAALELARQHLGQDPIVAVIFTHSHIDHFGGVWGIISKQDYQDGKVEVIAPTGFLEEATSENILAGIAMARRASYMYGQRLPRNERGHIGSGLGKSPAYGTMGLAAPTKIIASTGERLTIDGLEFVFQNAEGSEAPSEFTFAIPQLAAYCGAEVVTQTMHNLYTLRGAKVRDALKWTHYIDEMITLTQGSEVYFASHHWPVWGSEQIHRYLELHRDTYKFIHDQTVRLFNQGLNAQEIAERLQLPPALAQAYSNKGYYGTVSHNSKAVYQAYLGWYDANPANLNPLPPVDAAKRYVEVAGGVEQLIAHAQKAYDQGSYRWAAQLLNHLMFAEPNNREGKLLLANSYDQLGYQAQSGPWRDAYLSAAYELRHGAPQEPLMDLKFMLGILEQTPVDKFFQTMSVRLNADKAEALELKVGIVFTDLDQSYLLSIKNSVLHHRATDQFEEASAVLHLTHGMFMRMVIGELGLTDLLASEELSVDGSSIQLARFLSLFDTPEMDFNIVTP